VRDADRVIGLVEAAEKPPPSLLINRLRPAMVKRGDMLDTPDVLEILAIDLIGIIPEDEKIITSTNKGQPVALDDHSEAGAGFRRVAQRILGETVPFPSFGESESVLARFSKFFRG
jgi:septum site-determining protein MinD